MLQENSIPFSPVIVDEPMGVVLRFYCVFLLTAMIVAIVKLINIWIGAPPFLLKRQAGNLNYLRIVERSRRNTNQWIGLTGLLWAFVFSYEVVNFAQYADESMRAGSLLLLNSIRKLGVLTEFAAFVALLLFLTQWHMLNRAEQMRAWASEKAQSDPQALVK